MDTMDVPEILTASLPVAASSAATSAERPAKRKKSDSGAKRSDFCERIRAATGWCTTMSQGVWRNCTTDKSRRTLFVLQTPDGGGDQLQAHHAASERERARDRGGAPSAAAAASAAAENHE